MSELDIMVEALPEGLLSISEAFIRAIEEAEEVDGPDIHELWRKGRCYLGMYSCTLPS